MAKLSLFYHITDGSIVQDVNESFGLNTVADPGFSLINYSVFRLNSIFTVTNTVKAIAMVSGRILLQKQTGNDSKVNLILKPDSPNEFKFPVKYIVYRGLKKSSFLNTVNNIDSVKTQGSELLVQMANSQHNSDASEVIIPIETLFGKPVVAEELANKKIEEFFFTRDQSNTNLWSVNAGLELGDFHSGKIAIEIVLENPEYELTVEEARLASHTIRLAPGSDLQSDKRKQDLIRHFMDVAAFYGLNADIPGGIEYRNSDDIQQTGGAQDVYLFILDKFLTKNIVYLDIRNENGYSYNYYNNYRGISNEVYKNIKIGIAEDSLDAKKYYNNGWPIYTIDTRANGQESIDFFLALSISDNPRPLIALWHHQLSKVNGTGTIVSDNHISFANEFVLVQSEMNGFTMPVKISIPAAMANIIRIDYIKQKTLNVNIDRSKFHRNHILDYVFPLNSNIPWDSSAATQWYTNYHTNYIDARHNGYIIGKYTPSISSINIETHHIAINGNIPLHLSEPIIIKKHNNEEEKLTVVDIIYSNNVTSIIVLEEIDTIFNNETQWFLNIRFDVYYDSNSNKFIIENEDRVDLIRNIKDNIFIFYNINKISTSFKIDTVNLTSSNNIEIIVDRVDDILSGFAGFMETGVVFSKGIGENLPQNNDTIMFYASPSSSYARNGIMKQFSLNLAGATSNVESIMKVFENSISGVKIKRGYLLIDSLDILTFSFEIDLILNNALFLLGITKIEWEQIKTQAIGLNNNHIPLLKIKNLGKSLVDGNGANYYKYELVVVGLDTSGNFQEINSGIMLYSEDNMILTSKNFTDTYDLSTQQDNNLNYFINETLGENGGSGEGIILEDEPEFKTTFEEKNNLSKSKLWGKDEKSNRELLNLDPTMKAHIKSFKRSLDTVVDTDAYEAFVRILKEFGAGILNHAKAKIRIGNTPYTNKDGILYLARLIMQVILKNHPKILKLKSNIQQELSNIFEAASRGWIGSEKPEFPTGSSIKKVLISGFDPFGSGDSGSDADGYISNPSGNIALALDNTNVESNLSIKSVIFPVRYAEFNKGWVENFFKDYLNKVDMIITFSYGVDVYDFQLDRFASDYRGKNEDNNAVEVEGISLELDREKTFIESTLPFTKLESSVDSNIIGLEGSSATIGISHEAYWQLLFDNNDATSYRCKAEKIFKIGEYKVIGIQDISNVISEMQAVKEPSAVNYQDKLKEEFKSQFSSDSTKYSISAKYGSGGDYLSNEIFYRVARLREEYNTQQQQQRKLPTGHIHIGFNKDDGKERRETDRNKMLEAVVEIIRKMNAS